MTPNLSQIDAMQNQLNALKAQQTQHLSQQSMQSFPSYSQSLQDMVSKEVNVALQRILEAQQPQQAQLPAPSPAPSQPNPNDPNAALISTIDKFAQSILTKEQITWLMDPTILSGLPLFFKSEKGKQAVGLLFSEYQDYVNR